MYVHMYVQDTKCTHGRAVYIHTYIHTLCTYVCNVFTVYFQGFNKSENGLHSVQLRVCVSI